MSRIAASDLRKDISEILTRVAYQGERVTLQRNGKDIAAIIPLKDLEFLETVEDQHDVEEARASRAEVQARGTRPLSAVMADIKATR